MSALAEARAERVAYFAILADGEHWLELRVRRPDGTWGKAFAATPERADELARRRILEGADVYVGVLPRLGRAGERSRTYAPARALWADLDTARSVRKLELFEPAPTAIVASGGVDGDTAKLHAYWALASPLPAGEVKRHALRLAHYLEADLASTDAAHVLRVPGSRSHKTGRVARLVGFTGEAHELDELTGGLPDPPAPAHPPSLSRAARTVPVGERREALISLLGSMRRWGAGDKVLAAATRAFCEHQCAHDPARPLDLEHALAAARDVADRYPAGPAQPWGAWKEIRP